MIQTKLIKYGLLALGALVLALAAWWVLTEPGRQKEKALIAAAGQVRAEGMTDAQRDAIGTVVEAARRDGAYDAETRKAVDDLIKTPEDRRSAAAVAALCLRDAYKNNPSCVQLRRAGSH